MIAAHRGAWDPEPQNSLAAFHRAIALGADMIELDLRATRDGRLVAVHDAMVEGAPVADWAHRELSGAAPHIPLLEEVLALCAGRVLLNIELKVPGLEEQCLVLMRPFCPAGFIVTSFLAEVVDAIRRRAPGLATGLVAARGDPADLAAQCRSAGHRALFLHLSMLPPPGQIVAPDLFAWTVNGEAALTSAILRKDLAGIVTDEPALGLALRASLT